MKNFFNFNQPSGTFNIYFKIKGKQWYIREGSIAWNIIMCLGALTLGACFIGSIVLAIVIGDLLC